MASGTARSHRGGAGIGERRVGYNPCGECDLGRCTAHTACSRLVDRRLLVKDPERVGAVRGEGPIKGVMGRRDQATDPPPAPGRGAHNGRPEPGARADQQRAPPVTPPPAPSSAGAS